MKLMILGILILSFSMAQAKGVSAFRKNDESFRDAQVRVSGKYLDRSLHFADLGPQRTPPTLAVPLQELQIQQIPEVPSEVSMNQEFTYVRDTRFISSNRADFPRRITWLYPDDGCYARAEEVALKLIEHSFLMPKKIFAFGDLFVQTPNSASGSVSWWYHVAVAYRMNQTVYIFDAAIEPHRPITLDEWHQRLGGKNTEITYTICDARTYDTDADCTAPVVTSTAEVEEEERGYFQSEWSRLQHLRRDPEKELGDNPPWL